MSGNLKLEGPLALKAEKMLKDVCSLLEENNILYTLEGGTLLGIVRDNKLLPWDNDLDITTTQDFTSQLIKLKWKVWFKLGYKMRVKYYKKDVPPFKKGELRIIKIQVRKLYFLKAYTLMDIFVKKEVNDQYFWTVGIKKPVLKSVPSHFYKEFKSHSFNDHTYSIVKNHDEYLSLRYGEWKVPVKEYDFKKDDKAIVSFE